MNQTFNISRFMMLFKKNILEDWRRILLIAGSIIGCMLAVEILIAYTSGSSDFEQYQAKETALNSGVWLTIIAILSGIVITSGLFKSMGKPSTALSTLMCPASGFEKFLMRWTVGVPLFLIAAVLSAMLCDWIRVIYTESVIHCEAVSLAWGELIKGYDNGIFWGMITMYLLYQSLYMIGAAFFSKNHFLKTFICLFVISGIYMGVAALTILSVARTEKVYNELNWDTISIWVWTIAVLFNYLIVYVRVREMEIINRW